MSAPLSVEVFGDHLIALLPQLMQEIARYENNYVTTGKITCQQFLALNKIAERAAWKMNELAKAMELSSPAMTGLVDRLIKHALVHRRPDPQDRRVVTITITAKGRRIIKEVYSQKRQGMIEIFGRLSGEERRQYLDILEKLVQKLSCQRGSDTDA